MVSQSDVQRNTSSNLGGLAPQGGKRVVRVARDALDCLRSAGDLSIAHDDESAPVGVDV